MKTLFQDCSSEQVPIPSRDEEVRPFIRLRTSKFFFLSLVAASLAYKIYFFSLSMAKCCLENHTVKAILDRLYCREEIIILHF